MPKDGYDSGMHVDLVSRPSELRPHHLNGRVVVIFDVLRATTSIVTAIASGAKEVRVFGSLDIAQAAAREFLEPKYLCGEQKCLRPPGFDLGNSPADFSSPTIAGRTLFMSTTNGTRAIVAAATAQRRLVASLVNASATARCLSKLRVNATLLCAGTDGQPAPEDTIGAGAVANRLLESVSVAMSESAAYAHELFVKSRDSLSSVLRMTAGGQNIVHTGLERDIDFAARLDAFDVVAEAIGDPPVVRHIIGAC